MVGNKVIKSINFNKLEIMCIIIDFDFFFGWLFLVELRLLCCVLFLSWFLLFVLDLGKWYVFIDLVDIIIIEVID